MKIKKVFPLVLVIIGVALFVFLGLISMRETPLPQKEEEVSLPSYQEEKPEEKKEAFEAQEVYELTRYSLQFDLECQRVFCDSEDNLFAFEEGEGFSISLEFVFAPRSFEEIRSLMSGFKFKILDFQYGRKNERRDFKWKDKELFTKEVDSFREGIEFIIITHDDFDGEIIHREIEFTEILHYEPQRIVRSDWVIEWKKEYASSFGFTDEDGTVFPAPYCMVDNGFSLGYHEDPFDMFLYSADGTAQNLEGVILGGTFIRVGYLVPFSGILFREFFTASREEQEKAVLIYEKEEAQSDSSLQEFLKSIKQ